MADDGSVPFVSAGDVTHGYDHTDTSNGSGGGVGGGSSAQSSGSGKGTAAKYAGIAAKGLKGYSKKVQAGADKLTEQNPGVQSLRQGGRVKKTGLIHAHRGEEVVRPEEADKVRKFLKKEHGRGYRPGEAETGTMGDTKMAERKGDPKKAAAKFDPKRFEKKEDPKRTAMKFSPKKMGGKKMMKRKAGRGM